MALGRTQGEGGKYSKRLERIHVRWLDREKGEMKGTRTSKVMERTKRMKEGD